MKTFRFSSALLGVCLFWIVGLASCDAFEFDLEDPPDNLAPADIFVFERAHAHDTLPANGRATDTLLVLLPKETSTRTVAFKTTTGTLHTPTAKAAAEITVEARRIGSEHLTACPAMDMPSDDDEHYLAACVVFTAGTAATEAILQATVKGFADELRIQLHSVAPERISLAPERPVLRTSQQASLPVIATLARADGTPSDGTSVRFTFAAENDAPVGVFQSDTLKSAAGKATAVFFLTDPAYTGPIVFTAHADALAPATATLQIVP